MSGVAGMQIGAMEVWNLTWRFSLRMAKSGVNVLPYTHPDRMLDIYLITSIACIALLQKISFKKRKVILDTFAVFSYNIQ